MSRTQQLTDVYQIITNRIITELEQGTIPWRKSWAEAGVPQNLISRRPYKGINTMLLASLNYEQNYFLTFKQLKAIGGSVRKGEKSHMVIYWNVEEREDDQRQKVKAFLLRYYLVFNVAQCEDIPDDLFPITTVNDNIPIVSCERIVDGMPNKPKIVHKEPQPFYHRLKDFINLPRMKSFRDSEAYYLTLFHELIHSTGHSSRLNRPELMESESFGTELYSKEELTAEMGACYLQSYAGIVRERLTDSAAYIQGWLEKLKNDKRFIFHASSQAQKAVDYILNVTPSEPETAQETESLMVF